MGILAAVRQRFKMQSLTRNRYSGTHAPGYILVNGNNTTGVHVDQITAWQYHAFATAIRVVAESIAVMPWRVHRRTERGNVVATSHDASRLLAGSPNPEMSNVTYRETILGNVLSWGDSFSEIERTQGSRRPVGLWPVEPWRVTMDRTQAGDIVYIVSNAGGQSSMTFPAQDIFHVHGLGFDGYRGYSPPVMHAQIVGAGIAAETFAGSQYGNGGTPTGIIEHPTLKLDQVGGLQRWWAENFGGSRNAGQVGVLGEGATFKAISWRPEDMQLLQARERSVRDVALIYRLPPSKLGDYKDQPAGTVEEQNRNFVAEALQVWMTRLEQEADRKLLGQPGVLYSKINPAALLRGSLESRYRAYRVGHHRWLTTNEIRALEELEDTGPSGDLLLVPTNMITAQQALLGTAQSLGETVRGPGDGSSGGDVPEAADGATERDAQPTIPSGAAQDQADMLTPLPADIRAAMLEIIEDFSRRAGTTDGQSLSRTRKSASSDLGLTSAWAERVANREGSFCHGLCGPLRALYALSLQPGQRPTAEEGAQLVWQDYQLALIDHASEPGQPTKEISARLSDHLMALIMAHCERLTGSTKNEH